MGQWPGLVGVVALLQLPLPLLEMVQLFAHQPAQVSPGAFGTRWTGCGCCASAEPRGRRALLSVLLEALLMLIGTLGSVWRFAGGLGRCVRAAAVAA